MKNFFLGLILAAVLISGGYWIMTEQNAGGPRGNPPTAAQKYHCPMHPDYISDQPGDCPICGMKLVPVETAAAPAPATQASPQNQNAAGGSTESKGEIVPPEGNSEVPGYAPLRIPPERLQTMGVTTEEARIMSLDQSIHTVGMVTIDETRIRHVHTKFEGYIEQVFVNVTGEHVRVGQPLFTIFSPEIEGAQREYLLALKARDQFKTVEAGLRLPGIDLVEASRQRLALWDISPAQIARIEETREPIHALTVFSPVEGYVSAGVAVQGNRVMPSDTLYDITDLSAIWILADLYETNLPFVKIGDPATVTLPYQPGRALRGRINFINPVLDEKSRTVKARIVLENPLDLLKPDMYAEVDIGGQLGYGVAVPDSAVMGTGEREMVFVSKGEGVFEPRQVKTGVKVRGFYQIKSGVAAGERVVTGANFLLDSESKLKAAISGNMGSKR
jgi:RND family efflux transporter MFP subunit